VSVRSLVAALGVLAVVFVAGAASAAGSDRINIDFARAPLRPRSAFATIARHHLPGPKIVLTARARRIAVIHWNGNRPLLVAPTKGGGFCESLAGAFGGTRCFPGGARTRSGLNPGLTGDASGPIAFSGTFFDPHATQLRVRYQDGGTVVIPIMWVNGPIGAGFFVFEIPRAHRSPGHRPLSLSLCSAKGSQLTDVRLIQR
jgi:hypothetical protein